MKRKIAFILYALLFLVQCRYQSTLTKITQGTPKRFIAKMEGGQEVPPVTTTATGTGVFTLNTEKTELTFDVTVTGLSGTVTAAHLHNAPIGVGGLPVLTLTFTDNQSSGVWKNTDTPPFTPEMADKLEAGELFVNAHTALNPKGEIRGQIISDSLNKEREE